MYKLRPILKTYYDALEDNKVLGMKCEECGDVVWPPLPTCQECGSYHLDWMDMGKEAIIEEIRFEDINAAVDYTFVKANAGFVDKSPYCICVGHFPEGTHQFHAALYGVDRGNIAELTAKLPFTAEVKLIQMDGGFKSVGFKVKE